MPVAIANTFGIEDDVLGREADRPTQQVVGALRRSSILRSKVSAWPFSSNAITTAAAP